MSCAACNVALEDALILACEHNLCLMCAAREARGGEEVRCGICGRSTPLDPESAEQLRQMRSAPDLNLSGMSSKAVPLSYASRDAPRQRINLSAYPAISAALGGTPRSVTPSSHYNAPSPYPPSYGGGTPSHSVSGYSTPMHAAPQTFQAPPNPQAPQTPHCGQCERVAAQLRCFQCAENFCENCARAVHARGRLATHSLSAYSPLVPPLAPPSRPSSAVPTARSTLPSPRPAPPPPVVRAGIPCEEHPEEPVQYFCLSCESKPICAECVFRGTKHHSHLSEVLPLRKAFPAVRARLEETHLSLDNTARDTGNRKRELEEASEQLVALGEQAKAQMKRGFDEIRERLRTKEVDLFRRIDEMVMTEGRGLSGEIEALANRQIKLEELANSLASNVASNDELASLASFADAKQLLKESISNPTTSIVPRMQIPPEMALQHSEAINALHSAVSEIAGLIPQAKVDKVKPGLPQASNQNQDRNTPITKLNTDSTLMHAVSAAFAEPLSPHHLNVAGRRPHYN